ncbi:MAG: protein kinase [Candidatus Acidiferrales bacterium]
MSEPSNPKPEFPTPKTPSGAGERHDTVLLSDVPEPSAVFADPTAQEVALPHLATASLAALGQRYDILAEAGHGSMGNVYKARDRETGEIVALKLLKPEIASDQAMMERFKNELLFARKITHKNVCRVHEFNRIGGIACTSMEFVEGESLRSVLNRFGGLPTRKAIGMAQQICSGLKEAHAQGIVHRDLKPENVMIDAQGNVKIMDFGIARSMEAGTRLTGSMVGTPAYMAPEQVGGKPVDYRADIYSLGLMLYEMFAGSQAFQADTAVALALKQLREAPPPPHQVEPSIPVAIERAILKCLEKEPSRRFQSVAELESVLRNPAMPGIAAAPAIVPQTNSSHTGTPIPSFAQASRPQPKRGSGFSRVLLGAFVILAALGALRWAGVAKTAEKLPPPDRMHAPKPPDFAFEIPAAATPPPAPPIVERMPPAPVPTKASSAAGAKHKPMAEVSPARADAGPTSNAGSESASKPAKNEAPKDAQQRAANAFGETPAEMKAQGNSATYLWIGRYLREDRAKAAKKKIEDLGLPAAIVPRHGVGGDAFVVFAGPFGAKRISSVTQWLKAQGFEGVHTVEGPAPNMNQSH